MSKSFSYSWTPDYYLLHLQFDLSNQQEGEAVITRTNKQGQSRKEIEKIGNSLKSHRILISRSHPSEETIKIDYPEHLKLQVFQLDDRAYFPTESFYAD